LSAPCRRGNERTASGDYFVWLDRATVDRLERLRVSGESFSDVILRLAATERT
jgi:hypothetical protein